MLRAHLYLCAGVEEFGSVVLHPPKGRISVCVWVWGINFNPRDADQRGSSAAGEVSERREEDMDS